MAKEYNTLGWLKFAWVITSFAIILSIGAAGSFVQTQNRMAILETENGHLKESLSRIEAKVDKIDEFLRNQVR